MEGQLWPAEREFLHAAIIQANPRLVLEVGTWKGGGSTFQIAQALKKLATYSKPGKLITCEPDPAFFAESSTIYAGKEWSGIVECRNELSHNVIAELIKNNNIPDFLFFDGPEDPEVAYNDFVALEPHLAIGTYYCMHDFITTISVKAVKIRPYLENNKNWRLLRMLASPVSVGICLFQRTS